MPGAFDYAPGLVLFFGEFFADIGKAFQRCVEGFILLCKMQTDIAVLRLFEETGTRNCAYADILRQRFAQLQIAAVAEFRNIDHDVIRALRNAVLNSDAVKSIEEQAAHVGVLVLQPLVVIIAEFQPHYRGFLQGCRSAYRQEVVYLRIRSLTSGGAIT